MEHDLGEPVIGPLVDQGIRLERSYLVTTTWGEWKRRHPDSKVLSLDTGYSCDYRLTAPFGLAGIRPFPTRN